MHKRFITVYFLLLYTFFASAAQYSVKYLTSADGLSNSSVTALFQDSQGIVWMGTWDGLNCWNGRWFFSFVPDPSDETSICNNVIREIGEDDQGFIWVSTDRGIDRYDPFQGVFTHYFTEEAQHVESEQAFHLCFDYGMVCASVDGKGVYRYENGAFVLLQDYPWRISRFMVSVDGIPFICTKDSRLIQGKDKDIASGVGDIFRIGPYIAFQRNGSSVLESVAPVSGTRHRMDVDGIVNAVSQYDDGILVATSTGLYRFTDMDSAAETVISGMPVLAVYAGSQGIIWAGTDMRGAAQVIPARNEFNTVTDLFGGSAVRCFTEDDDGLLYVGTKGSGIFVFSQSGDLVRTITTEDGLPDNSVYSLECHDGYVWAGTDGVGIACIKHGCLKLFQVDPLLRSVYSIHFTRDGRMIAGTSGSGLYLVTLNALEPAGFTNYGAGQLGSYVVYSVKESSDGTIWVGTRGGGLRSISADGTISSHEGAYDVICLEEAPDGTIWAGSSTGLYHMDSSGEVLRRYTKEDGLPNATIHGIVAEIDGDIWAGTSHGLCRISYDGEAYSSYYLQDGLQDNEFSDGACFLGRGKIYFGGIHGFSSFDPAELKSAGGFPNLFLYAVYMDNERVPMDKNLRDGILTVKPEYTTLSFSFVPLDYIYSHRCELSYRLDGFNSGWVRLGTSSDLMVFSNLKPGTYTLNVRCTNAEGRWNPQSYRMKVKVLPKWYASTPARALYIILFLLLAWQILRFFRYKAKMQSIEDVHEGKLQFFTNIAHEFSNSLTLITGPCEQLHQDRKLTSAQKHCVDVIESNSERMQALIRELIMFRKAENGHLTVKITPVQVDQLAARIISLFRDKAEQSGIGLKMTKDPLMWNTDSVCLEKILFNLVSNAIKYTPAGGVMSLDYEAKGNKLVVKVTNTSVGITRREMARVFDRYAVLERFEKEISRGHVSNGIGLSLCKSLAEALGGSIVPDSDGSSYVSFTVTLPWQEVTSQIAETVDNKPDADVAAAPLDEDDTPGTVFNRDILVVDDNPDIRDFICSLFRSRFNVMEAGDGEEALKQISRRQPVLIISDVMMDGMDGNQLLRAVKDNPATRHIPFILLSARSSLENQIEGIESGADAYIGKPFSPRHLVAMVDRLIGHGQIIKEYSESAHAAVQQFEGNLVKNEDKDLIIHITDVIIANMDNEDLSVEDIASEIAVSKMKLYRKLKETVNMSPTEYIRHIRLENAARLLKTTRKTVQEIIYGCGFSSRTWFYREFQKKYGVTPNEYRKA